MQSDDEITQKTENETLPLLNPHVHIIRNIPFTERPLIKTLKAIYKAEKNIFLSISLGNAIITIGEGFPDEFISIINWSKWITIVNATVGASIGIYNMKYPESELPFGKTFMAAMFGFSAAVFSLQTILAIDLLDYLNQSVVDLPNLVFLSICLAPIIIGIGTTISIITDYKAEPLISTNNIAKFISFLGLQVANTGSTLQTALHYIFDLMHASATNYSQLFYRFLSAGLGALIIESTRFADTFSPEHRFNKYIQYLKLDSIPRMILSEILDLSSMFNYAVFWTSLYIQTCPTNKYPSVDVASFDIQTFLLLLIVMSPTLAALCGSSISAFIKALPQFLHECSKYDADSSDESDEELQLPHAIVNGNQSSFTINESAENRIAIEIAEHLQASHQSTLQPIGIFSELPIAQSQPQQPTVDVLLQRNNDESKARLATIATETINVEIDCVNKGKPSALSVVQQQQPLLSVTNSLRKKHQELSDAGSSDTEHQGINYSSSGSIKMTGRKLNREKTQNSNAFFKSAVITTDQLDYEDISAPETPNDRIDDYDNNKRSYSF